MKKIISSLAITMLLSGASYALVLRTPTTTNLTPSATTTATPTTTAGSATVTTQTDSLALLSSRLDALEKDNKSLKEQLKTAQANITKLLAATKELDKVTKNAGEAKVLVTGLDKAITDFKAEFADFKKVYEAHTHNFVNVFKGTTSQIAIEAAATEKNGQVFTLYTTQNNMKKNGGNIMTTPPIKK